MSETYTYRNILVTYYSHNNVYAVATVMPDRTWLSNTLEGCIENFKEALGTTR